MKKIFWLFLIIIFTQNLFAQETDTKRPKIGLVLSGGGAKGFAHIGVKSNRTSWNKNRLHWWN